MVAFDLRDVNVFLLSLTIFFHALLTLHTSLGVVAAPLISGISIGFFILVLLLSSSAVASPFEPSPVAQGQPQHSGPSPVASQQALPLRTPTTPTRASASTSSNSPNSSASDDSSSSNFTPLTTPNSSPEHQQKPFARTVLFPPLGSGARTGAGAYQRKRLTTLVKPVEKPSVQELLARHSQTSFQQRKPCGCACVEGWLANQSDSDGGSTLLPSAVFKSEKGTQTTSELLLAAHKRGSITAGLRAEVLGKPSEKPSPSTTATSTLLTPVPDITEASPPHSLTMTPRPSISEVIQLKNPLPVTPIELSLCALAPTIDSSFSADPISPSRSSRSTPTFVKGHKRTNTSPHHPYALAIESRRSRPSSPTISEAERSDSKKERPIEIVREAFSGLSSIKSGMISTSSDCDEERTSIMPTPTPASSPLPAEETAGESATISAHADHFDDILTSSTTHSELSQTTVTPNSALEPVITQSPPSPIADVVEKLSTPAESLSTPPNIDNHVELYSEITTTTPEAFCQAQAEALPTMTTSAEVQLKSAESIAVDDEMMEGIMEDSQPTTLLALDGPLPGLSAEAELLAHAFQPAAIAIEGARDPNYNNFAFHHNNSLQATATEFGFPSTAAAYACTQWYPTFSSGLYPTDSDYYLYPQPPQQALSSNSLPAPLPSFEEYASLMSATLSLPQRQQQHDQQQYSALTAPASTFPTFSPSTNIFAAALLPPATDSELIAASESTEMESEDEKQEIQKQEIQKLVDEALENMDASDEAEQKLVMEPSAGAELELDQQVKEELSEDFVIEKRRESRGLMKGRYFNWNQRQYERFNGVWTLRALAGHQHLIVPINGQSIHMYNVPQEHAIKLQHESTSDDQKFAFSNWFCDMEDARRAGAEEPEKSTPFVWSAAGPAAAASTSPSQTSTTITTTSTATSTASYTFLKRERDTCNDSLWGIQYRTATNSSPEWLYSISKENASEIQNGDLQLLDTLVQKQKEMMARLTGPPPASMGTIPTFGSAPIIKPSLNTTKPSAPTISTPMPLGLGSDKAPRPSSQQVAAASQNTSTGNNNGMQGNATPVAKKDSTRQGAARMVPARKPRSRRYIQ